MNKVELEHGKRYEVERKILLRTLLATSIAVVAYLLFSVEIGFKPEIIYPAIGFIILFMSLYIWTKQKKNFILKKRVVIIIYYCSVVGGFFVQGGLQGISIIDTVNMIIILSGLFSGKERLYYLIFYLTTIAVLSVSQIFFPEMIIDTMDGQPMYIMVTLYFIRLGLIVNHVSILRDAYQKEHKKTLSLLREVQKLNDEISSQNEELKCIQEELQSANENLEQNVRERTQKVEEQNQKLLIYGYINSHVLRAPVSRLMGLIEVLKQETNEKAREDILKIIYSEAHEIDEKIKQISKVINETDATLMQDLSEKARKLYSDSM
ncbi:MAG: hypothetical protein NZ529_02325 [Cytophagaceae bacterium]|nr:hypothetical protein [Cytophagaceae bacterium]MDW8455605.1 hypothetical protein [Cytophagaceae bacterium]